MFLPLYAMLLLSSGVNGIWEYNSAVHSLLFKASDDFVDVGQHLYPQFLSQSCLLRSTSLRDAFQRVAQCVRTRASDCLGIGTQGSRICGSSEETLALSAPCGIISLHIPLSDQEVICTLTVDTPCMFHTNLTVSSIRIPNRPAGLKAFMAVRIREVIRDGFGDATGLFSDAHLPKSHISGSTLLVEYQGLAGRVNPLIVIFDSEGKLVPKIIQPVYEEYFTIYTEFTIRDDVPMDTLSILVFVEFTIEVHVYVGNHNTPALVFDGPGPLSRRRVQLICSQWSCIKWFKRDTSTISDI